MSYAELQTISDDGRLWVFGSDRRLSEADAARIGEAMQSFLDSWTAHSRALRAGFDVAENRFLVVALDERGASASGCSIDALMQEIRRLEAALEASLLDGSLVWYRGPDGELRSTDREGFRRLGEEGRIGSDTVVFDHTIATLGELRDGRWELPVGRSWHARLLPDPPSTGS